MLRLLAVAGLAAGASGLSLGGSRRDVLGAAAAAATAPLWLPSPSLNPAMMKPALAAGAVPSTMLGKLEISQLIQGYWQLAGGHGSYTEAEAVTNMRNHFDAGVTTLDTADIYGPSELVVGKFVKAQPKAVVCTKFCCFRDLYGIGPSEVKARVLSQCRRLNVDKLPLVAFFWSDYSVRRYVDVALMLTELKAQGLIGEIGITNFDLKRLKEMKDAGVPVVSNQVQLSALDRRPLNSGMADYCAENDVKLIAFGTVGAGILSERYLGEAAPSPAFAADNVSLRMYSGTASRFGSWSLVQELLHAMKEIADAKGVAIANVAERYVLQKPGVGALLIGVRNSRHIQENVKTFGFKLDAGEMAAIDAIVKKSKGPIGDVWDLERGYV